MKKVLSLMLLAGMFSFYACGPSAEEKQKAEQQTKDSLAKVAADKEQATKDSLSRIAAAQKATEDSLAAAKAVEDSLAKAKKGGKPAAGQKAPAAKKK